MQMDALLAGLKRHFIEIASLSGMLACFFLVVYATSLQTASLSYVLFSICAFMFAWQRQRNGLVRIAIVYVVLSIACLGLAIVVGMFVNPQLVSFARRLISSAVLIVTIFVLYLYLRVIRERRYVQRRMRWEEDSKRTADLFNNEQLEMMEHKYPEAARMAKHARVRMIDNNSKEKKSKRNEQ